jgi:hypothetical protein
VALLAALYGRAGFSEMRAWLPFAFELAALGIVSGWAGAAAVAILAQASAVPRVAFALDVSAGLVSTIAVFFLGSLMLRVPEATACGHFLRWQSLELGRWMSGVTRSA